MQPTTAWERVIVSKEVAVYLRGTHSLFSRLLDGERIFTIRPNGESPKEADGGYYGIYSALKAKGMLP